MPDSFYIGYLDRAPAGVRRTMRRLIPLALALVLVPVFFFLQGQKFAESTFEFGEIQDFVGTFHDSPVPYLLTDSGAPVLLVNQGKFGAAIESPAGSVIRVSGTRIIRSETVMVEIVPGSEQLIRDASPMEIPVRGEAISVTGEIVEAKCFLGVMNPGSGATHRACARLCLRGGIPAMLHATASPSGRSGDADQGVLLAGISAADLSTFAAASVTIRGKQWSQGALTWIEVETIERLGSSSGLTASL